MLGCNERRARRIRVCGTDGCEPKGVIRATSGVPSLDALASRARIITVTELCPEAVKLDLTIPDTPAGRMTMSAQEIFDPRQPPSIGGLRRYSAARPLVCAFDRR